MVTILMNDYPKLKVRIASCMTFQKDFFIPFPLPPVCSVRWSRNICTPPSGMIANCDLGNSARYSQEINFLSLQKFDTLACTHTTQNITTLFIHKT